MLIFSTEYLKKLQPKDSRYTQVEYSPHKNIGRLAVVVHPSGKKVFKFQYWHNEKRRFIQIGYFKDKPNAQGLTLPEARTEFNRLSEQYQEIKAKGRDLKDYLQEQASEKKKQSVTQGSFGAVLDHYVSDLRSRRKRTADKIDKWFTDYIRNHHSDLLELPANDVGPEHIGQILKRIHKEGTGTTTKYRRNRPKGATTQVNNVRRALHAAFNVALKGDNDPRDLSSGIYFRLKYNPVAGTPNVSEWDRAGDRNLSFDEIREVWPMLDDMSLIPRILTKLCLVTGGQRYSELLKCPWTCYDLDNGLLTIPANVSKNNREHVVPLSDFALELLSELNRDAVYPFPSADGRYDNGTYNTALRRFCEKAGFDRFTPRDLRRTAESRMAEMGLPQEIRDRIQNHNIRNDVTNKHYNRFDYLEPKRKALQEWADHLRAQIHADNVVSIASAK